MPILDGYSATEEIRTRLGRNTTLIVGASAYPRSEIEDRGTQAGMDEFIGKPINPLEVAAMLAKSESLPGI